VVAMLECIIYIAIGFLLGAISGLTPGLHINTFAAILLALSPRLLDLGLEPQHLAVLIVASSISQTFLDIIPAVFVGAPDADTSLAVLPGHQLMLEGRGMEAIRLSALGSAGAVIVALLAIYPLSIIIGRGYQQLLDHMGLILVGIACLMILSEAGPAVEGRGAWAAYKYKALGLLLFLTSGLLGLFAFSNQHLLKSYLGLEPSPLLPLLSGLFGASFLVASLASQTSIPPQEDKGFSMRPASLARSMLIGGLAGSVVAWIPGVSPAVATTVARIGAPRSAEEFLVSLSGVNTANAMLALVALHVVGRARSGAAAAIQDLVEMDLDLLSLLIMAGAATAILSYIATLAAGGLAARIVDQIDYQTLSLAILLGLSLMAILFTGVLGWLIFLIATVVGLIAPYAGIRKTHAMGALMLPLIVQYL